MIGSSRREGRCRFGDYDDATPSLGREYSTIKRSWQIWKFQKGVSHCDVFIDKCEMNGLQRVPGNFPFALALSKVMAIGCLFAFNDEGVSPDHCKIFIPTRLSVCNRLDTPQGSERGHRSRIIPLREWKKTISSSCRAIFISRRWQSKRLYHMTY